MGTITEFLGHGEYLVKYDHVPRWMPAPNTKEETSDSAYVYMRKDFIEKYCKEWDL